MRTGCVVCVCVCVFVCMCARVDCDDLPQGARMGWVRVQGSGFRVALRRHDAGPVPCAYGIRKCLKKNRDET